MTFLSSIFMALTRMRWSQILMLRSTSQIMLEFSEIILLTVIGIPIRTIAVFHNFTTIRKGAAAIVLLPVLLRAALGDRALLRLDRLPPLPRRHHDRLRPAVGHPLLRVPPHQTGKNQAQCCNQNRS